jgi:hypothetical protein
MKGMLAPTMARQQSVMTILKPEGPSERCG